MAFTVGILHRPPRHPHAWIVGFVASQAAVAFIWWRHGAVIGLTALVASHLAFLWGTLWPTSRLFGPVLTRLPTQERVLWLTIDDGPSVETPAVLDLLDAHGAKATFFLVGDRALASPELVREIVRRGHGIGNHSASHPAAWFWALGPARMRDEIERAQAAITGITGTPPCWFRSVVGMTNPFVAFSLRRLGLARVAWSARGFDGVAGNVDRVIARIAKGLQPGAIVLMHEGAPHGRNVEMLDAFLRLAGERGYRCILPTFPGDGPG